MAEVLGSVASAIALVELAGKVTTSTYKYVSDVKKAPKDIERLLLELSSISTILINLFSNWKNELATVRKINCDVAHPNCLLQLRILLEELAGRLGSWYRMKGKLYRRLAWPFQAGEISGYLETLERHKSTLRMALSADQRIHLIEIERHVLDTKELVLEVRKNVATIVHQGINNIHKIKSDKYTIVLSWLNKEPFDKKHIGTQEDRQVGTGEWLPNMQEFQDWENGNSHSGLLWGHGIPGVGKTFLSSVVIDYLLARVKQFHYGVAYIYFEYKEKDKQNPTHVLSSLVQQLVGQLTHLPAEIEDLHDDLVRKGETLNRDRSFAALLAILGSFRNVFFVFDALDEIQRGEDNWLNDLLDLFHQMEKSGIKIFLTSRFHPFEIQTSLKNAVQIELKAKNEDIRLYIHETIHSHERAKKFVSQANCEQRTNTELVECSNGMFLLARFHVKYLCQQPTARRFLNTLQNLIQSPCSEKPLEPTYSRAMHYVQNQQENVANLALKTLSWLVHARRTLTVRELQEVVSVELGQCELDKLDIPEKTTLLDICGGLVTIDEKRDTIQLAHHTVHEYLVRNKVLKNADFELAMSCITYLSFDVFSHGGSTTYDSFSSRLESNAFFDYAAHHLAYHLKRCDEALSTDALVKFLERPGCIDSYMQASRYFQDLGSDYNSKMFCKYKKGRHPLHMASALGHRGAIKILLEKGGNVWTPDSEGRNALHEAAYEGDEEAVRLYLELGVDVSLRDRMGSTALHRAARAGHVVVIQLLLKKGASVSTSNNKGMSVIHETAIADRVEAARLLISAGANISTQDNGGWTPLHVAAHCRCEAMTELLLQNGVDISLSGQNGETALHLAVTGGSKKAVKLLLEAGADTSVLNKSGQTARDIAAHKVDKTMVQLFEEALEKLPEKTPLPLHPGLIGMDLNFSLS